MTETTVKAPTAEADGATEAEAAATPEKPAKTMQEKVTAAMQRPMPEFHVDFVNWLSGYGVDDIDLRSVLATMSLYNVFRATPEFIAKRDAVKADRATKTKPEKDLSTLTPAEAKAELEKIQAAQVAAQQRQAKQAERAAAIQAMLAEAGVSTASDADGEAVDEVAVDEETAEAF